ncbi:MAG TPA: alpha/beta hydrolase, partial [Prolixibacteraceae bacterium]|nr:alpha/beta hydrolase [Prolixibacteraceae bacterium]
REGIAVLRFDDRGVGKSEGDQGSATSVDFSTDAESAFHYLKTRSEIDSKSIGLMGHSEGGLIAPMVAARNHELGFIVMLAGPGMTGKELLPEQAALISKASGVSDENIRIGREINNVIYSMIDTVTPTEELAKKLNDYINKMVAENKMPSELSSKEMIDIQMKQLISPWMRYFLNYDPRPALRKVTCPVLALNGEKDLQVPPVENLREIEKALKEGGNSNYTIKQINGLNHLFQECKTGSPEEYSAIEQTFSPVAMKLISTWITKQVK